MRISGLCHTYPIQTKASCSAYSSQYHLMSRLHVPILCIRGCTLLIALAAHAPANLGVVAKVPVAPGSAADQYRAAQHPAAALVPCICIGKTHAWGFTASCRPSHGSPALQEPAARLLFTVTPPATLDFT